MTKHARKRLFYLLFALFIVIGSGAMLYAYGWRINPKTARPVKIGAVYIRPFPASASVIVGKKQIAEKQSLFSNGFFLNNLLPGTYPIRVEAEGYLPWERDIAVLPSLITQLEYVTLVPQKEEVITEGVGQFWLLENTLLIKTKQGGLIAEGKPLSGDTVVAATSKNPYAITSNRQTGFFFLERFGTSESVSFRSPTPTMFLVPGGQESTIVAVLKNAFRIIDPLRDKSLATISTKSAPVALAMSKKSIAWAVRNQRQDSSEVSFYQFLDHSTSTKPYIFPGTIIKMDFSERGTLGILQNRGDFYLISPDEGTQRILANDVTDFVFNENGSLVAALEKNGIEVFSFASPGKYYRLHIPDAETIESLSWYRDNFHLFLHYPDRVVFLDLLDASLQNFTVAAETSLARYEPLTNELYYVKNNTLVRKTFPK